MGRADEVVVHRHRVPVGGERVEGGVAPAVDGQPAQLLPGGPVEVHVASAVHGHPVRCRIGVGGKQITDVARWRRLGGAARAPAARRAGRSARWARTALGRRVDHRAAHHLHGAVHEHVARPALGHREHRRHQRASRPRCRTRSRGSRRRGPTPRRPPAAGSRPGWRCRRCPPVSAPRRRWRRAPPRVVSSRPGMPVRRPMREMPIPQMIASFSKYDNIELLITASRR